MPRIANKHSNAEPILYGDFSGGLNISVPAETVAKNEMQVCDNFEYNRDTGALKLRGGLVLIATLPGPIKDMVPVFGADAFLVRLENNKVYRVDQYAVSGILGTMNGDGPMSYAMWGDTNEILMCAGAKLYRYNGSTLVELSNSPERNDFVFVRTGRVVTADRTQDVLRYSGIGDPDNWNFDGTDADAVEIEVGYKDGNDMSAVIELTSDLVVFKTPQGLPGKGTIYRVFNEYPDWEVKFYSRGSSAWNHNSVASTTSDVIFITAEGIASLSTVTEYGDYKIGWPGKKVNNRISKELNDHCRMWKLGHRSQVWVRTGLTNKIWVYSYTVGRGAWTTFTFPDTLRDVCETGASTYVSVGAQVFRLDDMYGTDNGDPFVGRIKFQSILKQRMSLLKYVLVGYISMAESMAKLRIMGHDVNLPLGGQLHDIAYLDPDIAYLDDSPLVTAISATMRERINIRTWDATGELIVQRGPFALNLVGLEVAEV